MLFQLGVENNVEGRSLVWGLGHPGCFAYGADAEAALAAMPAAIVEYAAWIASRYKGECWVSAQFPEIEVVESFQVYSINEDYDLGEMYEVNAWFRHDWKPLTQSDVERGLLLLAWSREDLLSTVQGLSSQALLMEYPGERWNIGGILKHVGGAEWWYLDRLGRAFVRSQVPDDPFERLLVVRQRLIEVLPGLVDSCQVVGVDGEFWSPRKLLRRAVWHERDHTLHIQKLIQRM